MKRKNLLTFIALLTVVTMVFCACTKDKNTESTAKKDETTTESTKNGNDETDNTQTSSMGPSTDNYSVSEVVDNVNIVVNGKEVTPTDNNGNPVETIMHNGVVYLPIKTVAEITGLAYQWDGPSYTAYLGNMNGKLEYPTVKLEDMTSINHSAKKTESLNDNYGNRYGRAIYNHSEGYKLEYLLNMKYSKFKGTLYVPEGEISTKTIYLTITADGNTIYTSPEITRASAPINVDVNVKGYNDVKIEFSDCTYGSKEYYLSVCLGDAGFYQ